MYDVHPPSGTAAPRVYLWLQSLLWCSCSPVALLLTIQRGSEELQRNVPPKLIQCSSFLELYGCCGSE